MIYVFCFMPDVYSLPFLKNQDAKEVLGGQEGSHVRGHTYMFFLEYLCFRRCILQEMIISYSSSEDFLSLRTKTKGFSLRC